jgi:hypothetical protein
MYPMIALSIGRAGLGSPGATKHPTEHHVRGIRRCLACGRMGPPAEAGLCGDRQLEDRGRRAEGAQGRRRRLDGIVLYSKLKAPSATCACDK